MTYGRGDAYVSFLTAHDVKLVLLSAGLLMGATALAGLALGLRRFRAPVAVLAAVAVVVWLAVDRYLEGPLLIAFPGEHGLVLADLLVLPAVLVVGAIVVDELRRRRPVADDDGRVRERP